MKHGDVRKFYQDLRRLSSTKAKIKFILNLACFLVFSIFRNRKGAKTKYELT